MEGAKERNSALVFGIGCPSLKLEVGPSGCADRDLGLFDLQPHCFGQWRLGFKDGVELEGCLMLLMCLLFFLE